jgi:hypothetical protein
MTINKMTMKKRMAIRPTTRWLQKWGWLTLGCQIVDSNMTRERDSDFFSKKINQPFLIV